MKKCIIFLCCLFTPMAFAATTTPDAGVGATAKPVIVTVDAGVVSPTGDTGLVFPTIMVVPVVDAGTGVKEVVAGGTSPILDSGIPSVLDGGVISPSVDLKDGGLVGSTKNVEPTGTIQAPLACSTASVSVGTEVKTPETVATAPKTVSPPPIVPVVVPVVPLTSKEPEKAKAPVPVTSPDVKEATAAIQGVVQAAKEGRWSVLAGFVLTLLLVLIRRIPILSLTPKKLVPWVAIGIGVIGYVGLALTSGLKVSDALIQGLLTGLAGIGIWETIFTHFLKPGALTTSTSTERSPADTKTGPTS